MFKSYVNLYHSDLTPFDRAPKIYIFVSFSTFKIDIKMYTIFFYIKVICFFFIHNLRLEHKKTFKKLIFI